jgi:hypothetical protein
VPTLATPLSIGRVGGADIELVGATQSSEVPRSVFAEVTWRSE